MKNFFPQCAYKVISMNLFKQYLLLKKPYFKYIKSNLKTPMIQCCIFDKSQLNLMILFSKTNGHNLIEFSCYQHPNQLTIPFIILFDYSQSSYLKYFLCFQKKNSLQHLYPSFYWLEREVVEFFGLTFNNLNDTRNLLLDYNKNYNALLKYFPTSGFEEVYYDPFYDKVLFKKINFIEL